MEDRRKIFVSIAKCNKKTAEFGGGAWKLMETTLDVVGVQAYILPATVVSSIFKFCYDEEGVEQ
jgi:hypothetical protein